MVDDSVERRLADLEEAVAVLQDRLSDLQDRPSPAHTDELWALDGLEARAPDGAVIYVGSVRTPVGNLLRWQYGEAASGLFGREWSHDAERLSALGHPARLRILQAVVRGVNSVAGLAAEIEAGTTGQVYHHVKELVAAGWLYSPRRGVFDIPPSSVVPLLAILVACATPQS